MEEIKILIIGVDGKDKGKTRILPFRECCEKYDLKPAQLSQLIATGEKYENFVFDELLETK